MKATKSLWLILVTVVATTVILGTAISFGPAAIANLSPKAALAEELPADSLSAGIQATGTLHTLLVPPAAFIPEDPAVNYYNGGTRLYVNSGSGGFFAPVYLPVGAQVVKVTVFGYDDTASSWFQVTLNRALQSTGSLYPSMTLVSSSNSGFQKLIDSTVVNPAISDTYSYFLYAYFDAPSVQLYTVRIVYYY